MPISDEYGESIYGPVIDDYLDPSAIAYVVQSNNASALRYLTDNVEDRCPVTLPCSRKRKEGIVEWWCRTEYPDMDF